MRYFLTILLLISGLDLYSTDREPLAVKGLLDLRAIQDPDHFALRLNGEWEFYWKRMLHPNDFKGGIIRPDYYGRVPSYWTDYPRNLIRTSKEGYATYRLIVILPHGFKNALGVDLPVFDSSYDIYINDRYLGGNGIPAKTAEETKPEYSKNFFRYDPTSDSLSIVINVANFSHRRGGFWLPMKLGTFRDVQRPYANGWAAAWATTSFLFGFALFFLFFFLIYPKEKLMGFFSMAIIGLALRPFFTTHYLINSFISMSWTWIVRMEYLGLYLVIVGYTWFALTLYPNKYFKAAGWFITGLFALAFVMTLFLPVKIFSYATMAIYPSMLILTLYVVLQSIYGIIKKKYLNLVYLSAFIMLIIGVLHDIWVSLGKAEGTGYIMTYIIIVFVLIQAALLIYKWVKSYYEKEKLQNDLEFMNRNLEVLVNERTEELHQRTREIENQNTRIALQNKQLSDTLQLKNKIFSVIAHDLRSPVVNILYMLNLLKEKEYKEQYDSFSNASIQYAQQVISLLENMLVWGRDQEDKIRYAPAKHNLADIVLTNLSIFKETADKKDISVNFTQVGNSTSYIDKDLMDIIIRNLLSNAVKYTPRGGRISILLKDKSVDGDGILMKICDNGVGIPLTRQKYLFTSTEMTSTPGTENEKGTGLGLKLCHELVQINKGTISVESREGEGACFSITLPE